MNFSVYYEALIRNAFVILIILYLFSLSYESQQKESEGFPYLFITAPFHSFTRFIYLCKGGLENLFTNYKTVFRRIWDLLQSLYKALLDTLRSILNIFWNLIDLIETVFRFPFDLIMNFSKYMEELFEKLSRLFRYLYYILLKILSPIYDLVKIIIPYLLNFLRYPLDTAARLGALLFDIAKKLAQGVANTARVVISTLFDFIKNKLLKFSIFRLLNILISPLRWLLNLLKMLYLRFEIIPFLKKLYELLINLPYKIYIGICDLINILYKMICNFAQFVIQTLIWMFYDLIDFLNITKYLPEFLKPLFDMLYRIGKYLLDLFMKIIVLPYRFAVYLIKLLKHPIQTIIEAFNSLVNLIRQVASALVRILESSVIQFILGIMKTPLNLLRRLLSHISFRNFLRICSFPLNALKYFGRALSSIARAICNSIMDAAKSIANGIVYLLSLLSNFSLQKLIYYLLSPIRFIIRVIKDLLGIPFLNIIIRILEFVGYRIVFLINIPLKLLYIIFESFIIFFSKNLSLRSVFDMWDNVCWPRDTEYCKQILAKAQNNNNNNFNTYNNEYYNYRYNNQRYA